MAYQHLWIILSQILFIFIGFLNESLVINFIFKWASAHLFHLTLMVEVLYSHE